MEEGEKLDLKKGRPIGGGAFGSAYVFKESDGSELVVKIVEFKNHKEQTAYKKECEMLASLSHPHVVSYKRSMEINETVPTRMGIGMEYCERGSFDKELVYKMDNVLVWSEQLFGALQYIHKQSVNHRDIKPANIFVKNDYSLKLGDFGFAKEIDTTRTGTYGGTERYMSPPQMNSKDGPMGDTKAHGLSEFKLPEPPKLVTNRRELIRPFGYFDHGNNMACDMLVYPDYEFSKGLTFPDFFWELEDQSWDEDTLRAPVGPQECDYYTPLEVGIICRNRSILGQLFDDETAQMRWHKQDGTEESERSVIELVTVDILPPELVNKFNNALHLLSPENKDRFFRNANNLIAETIRGKKLYFPGPPPRTEFSESEIVELFKNIFIESQESYIRTLASKFYWSYLPANKFLPSSVFFQIVRLIDAVQYTQQKLVCSSLIFKVYFSINSNDEWLLVADTPDPVFIRSDFSQQDYDGKWVADSDGKVCKLSRDTIQFSGEQEIDLSEIVEKLKKTQEKIVRNAKIYMTGYRYTPLADSKSVTDSIAILGIGSDLPIPNYLFQIRNPPRCVCSHELKCKSKSFVGIERGISAPEELGLPYYECTTDEALDYLGTWTEFVSYLGDSQHSTNPSIVFAERVIGSSPSSRLILMQCSYEDDPGKYLTLLDHPNAYDQIPCLDADFKICEFDKSKILGMLNERSSQDQRFLVVSKEGENSWSQSVLIVDV